MLGMKNIFIMLTLLLFSGCMSTQEAAKYYDNLSAQELCMSYLTSPSHNIYQSDRQRSIYRRGIDCAAYGAAANAQVNRTQAFQQSLENLSRSLDRSSGYSTPSSPRVIGMLRGSTVSGLTRICYYNSPMGITTLNISSAGICPLSN